MDSLWGISGAPPQGTATSPAFSGAGRSAPRDAGVAKPVGRSRGAGAWPVDVGSAARPDSTTGRGVADVSEQVLMVSESECTQEKWNSLKLTDSWGVGHQMHRWREAQVDIV